MRILAIVIVAILAGCTAPIMAPDPAQSLAPDTAVRNFIAVIDEVEPMAEQLCLDVNPRRNCDFVIAVDDDPNAPANAFQTEAGDGTPLIIFTLSLIAEAQNRDELAFILGHEAGHHILSHIAQTERTATMGAILAGILATRSGLDAQAVDRAVQLGGGVAARAYSKDYEFQADLIGTRIAFAAGYDPVLGAKFFDRIPDPGNRFLGSHPGNNDRQALVKAETARLRNAPN